MRSLLETRKVPLVLVPSTSEDNRPSTSKDNGPKSDPEHLVGYQKDPELRERQREQQRAESGATKATKDLRAKIMGLKRAGS